VGKFVLFVQATDALFVIDVGGGETRNLGWTSARVPKQFQERTEKTISEFAHLVMNFSRN
jgi:hypothetical protein